VEMRFKVLDGSEAAVLVIVLFSYFDVLTYFCHVCLTTKSTHINKTGEYVCTNSRIFWVASATQTSQTTFQRFLQFLSVFMSGLDPCDAKTNVSIFSK
jgi:hypothetical protein